MGIGCYLGGGSEPASQVGFEAVHVGCAGEFRLARDFIGDIIREEDVEGLIEETIYTAFPKLAAVGLELRQQIS